jgi:hypothetical protein
MIAIQYIYLLKKQSKFRFCHNVLKGVQNTIYGVLYVMFAP